MMNRKDFVVKSGIITAGLTIPFWMQSCVSLNRYAEYTITGNKIKISKNAFLQKDKDGNDTGKEKDYLLIKYDRFDYPIIIFKTGADAYSALLMVCSHKGCELKASGKLLVCPCHGSEFSEFGKVLSPPAEEDLISFKTESDDEFIYVTGNK